MREKELASISMEYLQVKNLVDSHKKIIKPWKKNSTLYDDRYSDGWNDCLKEIEKNHKKFMKYLLGQFTQASDIVKETNDQTR